jgi:hypothetical protein
LPGRLHLIACAITFGGRAVHPPQEPAPQINPQLERPPARAIDPSERFLVAIPATLRHLLRASATRQADAERSPAVP